ncbi:MAG: hypothetical protein RPS47_08575 [Colwellia sp.]
MTKGDSVLDLNKLHKYLYLCSISFVVFEVLGFSDGGLDFNLGPISSEVEVGKSKYFTYLLLVSVIALYALVCILSFKSYVSKFWSVVETSEELLKTASETVQKKLVEVTLYQRQDQKASLGLL